MSKDHEEEVSTQTQVGKPRRTNSLRFNADEEGKRRATLLKRVHVIRMRGERIQVSFDSKGQPIGKEVVNNYPTISQDDWERFITYRPTADFKRLSQQGSKIRKKNKYGSTTGRDGYGKRDQEIFEQTGEYADRYVIWRDTRLKPDGEYKNPSIKIIDEAIIAALERTMQELCAKHGINRETMVEEAAPPTVDQHNSFKASCTLNEKEADVSEAQPMPNASKECQLFLTDFINGGEVLVAIGRAYMDCVPTDTVHGIPLGEGNVRVTISIPKLKRALLPIPTHEVTYIEETVRGFVASPKKLVVLQSSLSQASRGLSQAPDLELTGRKRIKKRAGRKKLQSQPEVQQQTEEEVPTFDFNEIHVEMRPLAYYAQSSLSDGSQISCPPQQSDEMPIYIGYEDVFHFITFKEISTSDIMVYISYLSDCCARAGLDQRFEFISPFLVSPVQQNVDRVVYIRERADNIIRIITNVPRGRLVLMPYNSGQHWILAVINPWDNSVLYFNPLGNDPGEDFQQLITLALNDWKLLVGRGITKRHNCKTLIQTARCPIQQGNVQCGYFVLGFMREITLNVDGLALLQNKTSYTEDDLNLVMQEWTRYVMSFIQY
ncbi:hypothetical protein TIFTF001_041679 [Ficus carica]|uniref:Ubiquitin-like protease family profile domain-containing protein n=1 Tax=Ficus carica TaxID=3494 RepID=A0AA87ZBX4_FICCA|nr:hypothetical protein TIFTF001_041679 [Ficus carica]